jgi:hypothetical protein
VTQPTCELPPPHCCTALPLAGNGGVSITRCGIAIAFEKKRKESVWLVGQREKTRTKDKRQEQKTKEQERDKRKRFLLLSHV